MGDGDIYVQNILWNFIVPGIVMFILIKYFKKYFIDLYEIVYAYFIDKLCSRINRSMGWRKDKLFSELSSMASRSKGPLVVLEIGVGSGSNFKYIPSGSELICVDPNRHFDKYLEKRKQEFRHVVFKEFIIGSAEDLSFIPNNSIDAVICTFVLCSVNDLDMSLNEVKRVLRKVSSA